MADETTASTTTETGTKTNEEKSSTKETQNSNQAVIKVQADPEFLSDVAYYKQNSNNLNRSRDKGIVNTEGGNAVALKGDGSAAISGGKYSKYHMTPDGKAREVSLESQTVTPRKRYEVDEMIVNSHKQNQAILELSDFRYVQGKQERIVGNLLMAGAVLTVTWDETLKRRVLVRRPTWLPMFSSRINAAEIPDQLQVPDNTKVTRNNTVSVESIKDPKYKYKQPTIPTGLGTADTAGGYDGSGTGGNSTNTGYKVNNTSGGKTTSKYYKEEDFACKHCGQLPEGGIDPQLIAMVDDICDAIGRKVSITSCYRCYEHNQECGGVENSQHLYGRASDLDAEGIGVDALAQVVTNAQADGIGRYYGDEFVHGDVRDGRQGSNITW